MLTKEDLSDSQQSFRDSKSAPVYTIDDDEDDEVHSHHFTVLQQHRENLERYA